MRGRSANLFCWHWIGGVGYCLQPPVAFFMIGYRCPLHTPAAIAGRPEPPPGDPPRVRPAPPMGASLLFDDRAIASGKKRASHARFREAQARVKGSTTTPAGARP